MTISLPIVVNVTARNDLANCKQQQACININKFYSVKSQISGSVTKKVQTKTKH